LELVKTILLFIGGLFAGLYAGNVGGAALVSVPLLIFTGISIHVVIATQRLAAMIAEFFCAVRFYKAKQLDLNTGLFFGLFAVFGSIIGANISLTIDEKILNLIVSIMLLGVFGLFLVKDKLGLKERLVTKRNKILTGICVFFLSIYGGFFGAGFGFFVVVLLVLFGFSFTKGAAIGRVIGFFMSLAGTLVFIQSGLINFPYAISLGAGFSIGGWIGISIALKKGNAYIRTLMIIIILLSILRLLITR